MKQQQNKTCSGVRREMFRVVDLMREQNSEEREKIFYKLTFNQLRMIHRVYLYKGENNGQGISLKQLAERLGITSAAASEMVDTLVKKGVLIRSVDPRDRRAIAIDVEEALQQRLLAGEAFFDRIFFDFLETLDEEKREAFVNTLDLFTGFVRGRFAENGERKDD